MKHLKRLKIKPQVGDYVTFIQSAFNIDIVHTCAKITMYENNRFYVDCLSYHYKVNKYEIFKSILYEHEITGFASQEEINFFELNENIYKYNL